jgi:hypothetical protein
MDSKFGSSIDCLSRVFVSDKPVGNDICLPGVDHDFDDCRSFLDSANDGVVQKGRHEIKFFNVPRGLVQKRKE